MFPFFRKLFILTKKTLNFLNKHTKRIHIHTYIFLYYKCALKIKVSLTVALYIFLYMRTKRNKKQQQNYGIIKLISIENWDEILIILLADECIKLNSIFYHVG